MKIFFIRNYKRKLIMSCLVLALWVTMFFLTDFFIHNSLIFNITINNCLSFSYPLTFEVSSIYINEQMKDNAVKTNYSFRKPVSQMFSTYKSIKGKFSFSYPSIFTLSQQDFSGSDILYHIDFHDKPQTSHGFVQVWNLPYSLKEFLDKSKAASLQNYKYFSSNPITVNGLPGYYWSYSVLGNDGKYIKGSEVFFKKGNLMYRISYFVPESSWNKTQQNIYWNIVNSFKTY